MSQEFANLYNNTSLQPTDLNLRIRSVKGNGNLGKRSPLVAPAKTEVVSKAPTRLVDSPPTIPQGLRSFLLPTVQSDFRPEAKLNLGVAPQLPPNYVSRKRLLDKLPDHYCPLMQIIAPAGYGKSTLLAEWLRVNRRTSVWLSLNEGDNLIHHFWKRIVQAIDTLLPGSGTSTLQMLSAPMPPTIQAILPVLCNDVDYAAAKISNAKPLVLVIDDYHVIKSVTIHTRLFDLIRALPQQLQVIIVSRSELPVEAPQFEPKPVVRLKDLAFTMAETAEFFKKSTNCPSVLTNAIEISEHVEGWVAGLHLIAKQIEQNPHALNEILFLKDRKPIVPALMMETFCSAHPTLQVFMLCTSMVSKFTPEMCDCLFTGEMQAMLFGSEGSSNLIDGVEIKNSQDMIEFLEQSGQFMTRCDQGTEWRRYHPMFGEMLRAELRQRCQELELILRDRSQIWYLRQDGINHKKPSR